MIDVQMLAYMCSRCSYICSLPSKVIAHQKNGKLCHGATIMTVEMHGQHPPIEHVDTPIRRSKPGPRGLDLVKRFRNVLPWNDVGARIKHVLGTPDTLRTIFQAGNKAVPVRTFNYLWGEHAPRKFQSIIKDHAKFCYVSDDGTPVTTSRTKQFINDITELLFDVLMLLQREHRAEIPADVLIRVDVASDYYHLTTSHTSLRDAVLRTEQYLRYRNQVAPTVTKIAEEIRPSLQLAFNATRER